MPTQDAIHATPPEATDGADAPGQVEPGTRVATPRRGSPAELLRPLAALLLLFLFLVGVQALSTGIKGLGKGAIDSFLGAATNPFIGLVAGILATTLVQSSSVTTSLVVGMVASNALSFEVAIPIVMGANIGTTVTNTIAAMAQIGRRNEFRRAFAAATCHDFFNYLTVLVLLPLELATGFLTHASAFVNGLLPATAANVEYHSPFKTALKAGVGFLQWMVSGITSDGTASAIALIILSALLIFGSLSAIVSVMKKLVLGRLERSINRVLGRGFGGGLASISAGMVLTVLVQSSSITTSVLVPLAGAGLIRLWQVFPVTVGANIGTTVTALLASLAVDGPGALVARQIALVHLLFNVAGMMIFYVPPPTRRLPMLAAQWLAKLAVNKKRWALAYVIGAFYGVPAALVFVHQLIG